MKRVIILTFILFFKDIMGSKDNCLENEENTKRCKSCRNNFILYGGVCLDGNGLNNFINNLKTESNNKQKKIIDIAVKNEENKTRNSTEEKSKENSRFQSFSENLKNFRKNSEREYRIHINNFIAEFEQNMNVLLSLTNLFEEKTIYEIDKEKVSILELLDTEKIDSRVKLDAINSKMKFLRETISEAFSKIKSNIESYENISSNKIKRAQKDFMTKNDKFFTE
jgi:hypothetical protein